MSLAAQTIQTPAKVEKSSDHLQAMTQESPYDLQWKKQILWPRSDVTECSMKPVNEGSRHRASSRPDHPLWRNAKSKWLFRGPVNEKKS